MINPVDEIKSDSNQEITADDLKGLNRKLDHIDAMLHEIQRDTVAVASFIEANRDAISRAKTFLDPGAKLRSAMGRGRRT